MSVKKEKSQFSQVREKVNWLNVLHFYQPPFQDVKIVQKKAADCYLPISRFLLDRPNAKAVVNINGCLLEMLYAQVPGGKEVVENLKSLFSLRQIEITGTGKYHPILPLIPKKEVERQLALQEESLIFYLGMQEASEILFLPELAYLPEQMQLIREKGYRWVIVDEISIRSKKSTIGKYQLKAKENGITLLVRDRDISEALGNFQGKKYSIHTSEDFLKYSLKKIGDESFLTTAMDVEVFSRQQERWKLLAEIYDNPSVNSISVKQISKQYKNAEVETIPASWSTSKKNISRRIYYPLWHHPQNRLHRLLWQLLDLTLDEVRSHGSESQNKTMDKLLNSRPFFWSSCMPWWNGVIPEKASDNMVNLLAKLEGGSDRLLNVAQSIRKKIYDEVSMLNKTGRAKELQNEFLKEHGLGEKDISRLIHHS